MVEAYLPSTETIRCIPTSLSYCKYHRVTSR